ncbi:MAG: cbb3-type cytochrome oxidase assembly protein CcoS [Phycisphaerae bacterium]
MIAMSEDMALLVMWTVFSVLALAGVIAVFIWAIRSRQFADQDRARYLALDRPDDEDKARAAANAEGRMRNDEGMSNV